MTYSSIGDVRLEAGNIPSSEYSDADITKKLNSAFSRIQLLVGRALTNPFLATEPEYDFVRELEVKIAAKDVLKAYGGEAMDKIKELDAEITADMAFLKENVQEIADTGDVNILMATTPYLSYGAAHDENPDDTTIRIYRSTADNV